MRRALLSALLALAACPAPPQTLDRGIAPPNLQEEHERFVAVASWPGAEEAFASRRDLWGERALQEPDGPSYAFFERLLPPLRYVSAAFRHYPIVLGAPGGPRKARIASNGSAVNPKAHSRTWKEVGTTTTFRVGGAPFGEDLSQLEGPHYAEGYLPIVRWRYRQGAALYSLEAFGAVEFPGSDQAAVLARIGLEEGQEGFVQVGSLPPRRLTRGERTDIFVDAKPDDRPDFDGQRAACVRTWKELLARGVRLEVPEQRVNDAWRALVIGNYLMLQGDRLDYSVGNQYERQYAAESGDAVRSLLLFGQWEDTPRLMVPVLDYQRRGLTFHQAGFQLQLLAWVHWRLRDPALVRRHRARWSREVAEIVGGREKTTGLLPRERHSGDIAVNVHSLSTNANCWRGLRDIAAVLEEVGEEEEARRIAREAEDFRKAILAAVERSERRDVDPPFIPIALFGDEDPPPYLTATRATGYWNLLAPYVLGSGVLGLGSEREEWILRTFQERGGLCMGMVRVHLSDRYTNTNGVDDLYGLRYVETLLRRDEPDRALVSFYGKLAQGMTRDTYVSAEGTGLMPLDRHGRPMYLPPNSAANAFFLFMLRELLVQDGDLDDDGRPETLRLLFATPRPWLADGAMIRAEGMPTAFGPVSVTARSRLPQGEVAVDVDLPPRAPSRVLLRARVPPTWRVTGARIGDRPFAPDPQGTVDLTGLSGRLSVVFKVTK